MALRVAPIGLLAAGLLLAGAQGASAWHAEGHRQIAQGALDILPPELPEYFRSGGATLAPLALEPDLWKTDATPVLRAGESPEHYLDSERLRLGRRTPERSAHLAALGKEGLTLTEVGALPWAIAEWTDRLALAFAQHRRHPRDGTFKVKTLIYGGILAHYSGDLVQPLHTTIHHDGWELPDGSSPKSGIHHRVDDLLGIARFDRHAARAGLEPSAYAELDAAIDTELAASHERLDALYSSMEPLLLESRTTTALPQELEAFTCERYRAGVRFLASLYLTAWQRSASLELPEWAVGVDEGNGPQTANELPQPQVPVAFGLLNLKPAPFMPKT